ncbi:plasmid replication DNA-binding protein [Psychrobacter aquimaris]|uniref:plasmid replication DNA-binding protein n=1 Tax=Psychrobacter aquimaris TaxID=292733 RepID=UPI003FD2C989
MSVTKAAKEWGVSRTTIYQKINYGELSRTADKKIDTSEMLRVFGEPVSKKRTEQFVNINESTHSNSQNVQDYTALKHQLELEKLKNDYLQQQINEQKQLIENCQQQISQLNKTLAAANASIQDFAQVRLLEFKGSEPSYDSSPELKQNSPTSSTTEKKKKSWWRL